MSNEEINFILTLIDLLTMVDNVDRTEMTQFFLNSSPWERKKYAVWLASDRSPNKETILYRVPPDISRLIISYI